MALLHVNFFSEVLGMSMNMDVILPQSTNGQIGMKGNRKDWDEKIQRVLEWLPL